ncbi:MAG: hypothetical protein KME26_33010 [Oscillatoria princeps RMCB-10]|jgi:Ni,Fe-hydrogenase I cytochrome b subunit|nr:hypothetical protein [Oscillatoria princeps RMCB-10]
MLRDALKWMCILLLILSGVFLFTADAQDAVICLILVVMLFFVWLCLGEAYLDIWDFISSFSKNGLLCLCLLLLIGFVYFGSRGDANAALACLGNFVFLFPLWFFLCYENPPD